MATIYKRKHKQGNYSYYFNISINGKRTRRFAGYSLEVAKDNLKKLEYELTFKVGDEYEPKSFSQALDSFKNYIITTNINSKQVRMIYSKIKWFADYCSENGISNLKDIKSEHAMSYIGKRSQVKVQSKYNSAKESIIQKIKPITLNREIGFIKRFFN